MLREQRWVPDNCANPATGDACSIIEEWDDSVPDIVRIHSFVRIEKMCSRHSTMGHNILEDKGYSSITEENKRKNVAWLMARTIKPALSEVPFGWGFDTNGVLTINFASALSNLQKMTLQNQADIQFGAGKVTVL